MNKITNKEFKKLLQLHKKWLNNEVNGKRLDLTKTNLKNINFKGANLNNANLNGANLIDADLRFINLSNANLNSTNLNGADLSFIDLSNANLRFANLSNTNLYYANLNNADLRFADLSNANLKNANLSNTNLFRTKLNGADLYNTILDDKEKYRLGVILKKNLIGYKKCRNNRIVKLLIPKGAIVYCINGNKYRTNKAKVISIDNDKDTQKIAYSNYDFTFSYQIGKTIEIKNFDLKYNIECSTGIHFFKTKKEAKKY